MHLAPVRDGGFLCSISAGNYWCDQGPIPSSNFPPLPRSLRSDHLEILPHLFVMCEFPPRAESITVLKCDALTHGGRKQRGVGDYITPWTHSTFTAWFSHLYLLVRTPCLPVVKTRLWLERVQVNYAARGDYMFFLCENKKVIVIRKAHPFSRGRPREI